MQHFRKHAVKVSTLIGVLGLCLVLATFGCSSEPKYPELDPCDGPGLRDCFATMVAEMPDIEPVRVQNALGDTVDKFDGITRLVLSYDSTANTFTGTVANTTEKRLTGVGVVVYLDSHESWLGPAPLVDLAAGQVLEVTLPVDGTLFTTWSADANIEAVGIAPDVGMAGIQNGVRSSLNYDPTANAFTGTVENITGTLGSVTIEVRLYGPNDRGARVTLVDLAPS